MSATPGRRPSDARDDGLFMRAAAVIGDLNSPFYGEERQRDVWNEASAVGFQLAIWLGFVAANVMIWAGGTSARPYALGTFAVVTIPSIVVLAYAERLGVRADDPEHLRRGAMIPAIVLIGTFLIGLAFTHSSTSGGFWGGFSEGLSIGGGIGGAGAVIALGLELRRGRRRSTPQR